MCTRCCKMSCVTISLSKQTGMYFVNGNNKKKAYLYNARASNGVPLRILPVTCSTNRENGQSYSHRNCEENPYLI